MPWPGKDLTEQEYLNVKQNNFNPFYALPAKVLNSKMKEERYQPLDFKKYGLKGIVIPIEKEFNLYMGGTRMETYPFSLDTAPSVEKLSEIKVPVLIFNGGRTNCAQKDWGHHYVNIFPLARLKTVAQACHDPWFSDPAFFTRECNNFITKLK